MTSGAAEGGATPDGGFTSSETTLVAPSRTDLHIATSLGVESRPGPRSVKASGSVGSPAPRPQHPGRPAGALQPPVCPARGPGPRRGLARVSRGRLDKTTAHVFRRSPPLHGRHLQGDASSHRLAVHGAKRGASLPSSGTAEGSARTARRREAPRARAARSRGATGRDAGRKCARQGAGLPAVRRRRPAAKAPGPALSPPAYAAPPVPKRPSVSAPRIVCPDDMSNKEGGVLDRAGPYLLKGGGSPALFVGIPLPPRDALPLLARGGGRPGGCPGHAGPPYTSHLLKPSSCFCKS